MHRSYLILSLLFFIAIPSKADVILSEIMFHPPQSEYYEEFIELFNFSGQVVDLTGFLIGDQMEQDSLAGAGEGLLLPPGQFALILDPGYWGNSTIYDNVLPVNALVVTIDDNAFGAYGLRNNPADTVILIDPTGTIIATLAYGSDNPAGYSEEKIRLSQGDAPENWTNSLIYLGTPGFTNSVNPPEADIVSISLLLEPNPVVFGSFCSIYMQLVNLGQNPVSDFKVIFALGQWSEGSPDSILGEALVEWIAPLDSADVSLIVENPLPGPHDVFVWHTATDSNPSNDTLRTELVVGYPDGSLILNEIYPAPHAGQCEWVELYNPNAYDVNLYAFQFSDEDTADRSIVANISAILDAEAYALIAADTAIYSFSPPPETPILILGSDWPALNNDGDTPAIFDAAGCLLDAVPYTGWDISEAQSLERIYTDGASDDPQNWQPSYDPSGSTPGRQNSYGSQIEPPASSGSLTFQPDPFDPDRHEGMHIEVGMPKNTASLSILIFDLRGRQLKTLFDGVLPPSPLIWNGRDSEGRRLPPGAYIIFAEFRDHNGSRQKVIKEPFVIAGKL
jgi:hypothetical protein